MCCSCPTVSNEDKKDKGYDILHLLITSKVVSTDIDQRNKKKDDHFMINIHFELLFLSSAALWTSFGYYKEKKSKEDHTSSRKQVILTITVFLFHISIPLIAESQNMLNI